jgi:hypothetical protein
LTSYLTLVTELPSREAVLLRNLHLDRLSLPDNLNHVRVPRPGTKNDREFSKVISKTERKGIPYLKKVPQAYRLSNQSTI